VLFASPLHDSKFDVEIMEGRIVRPQEVASPKTLFPVSGANSNPANHRAARLVYFVMQRGLCHLMTLGTEARIPGCAQTVWRAIRISQRHSMTKSAI